MSNSSILEHKKNNKRKQLLMILTIITSNIFLYFLIIYFKDGNGNQCSKEVILKTKVRPNHVRIKTPLTIHFPLEISVKEYPINLYTEQGKIISSAFFINNSKLKYEADQGVDIQSYTLEINEQNLNRVIYKQTTSMHAYPISEIPKKKIYTTRSKYEIIF